MPVKHTSQQLWPRFTFDCVSPWSSFTQKPCIDTRSRVPAWIRKYMHYKVWDEITYPFPNFNGGVVEVWERKVISSCTLLGMAYDYLPMLGLKFQCRQSNPEERGQIHHVTPRRAIMIRKQRKARHIICIFYGIYCACHNPNFRCMCFINNKKNGHISFTRQLLQEFPVGLFLRDNGLGARSNGNTDISYA